MMIIMISLFKRWLKIRPSEGSTKKLSLDLAAGATGDNQIASSNANEPEDSIEMAGEEISSAEDKDEIFP